MEGSLSKIVFDEHGRHVTIAEAFEEFVLVLRVGNRSEATIEHYHRSIKLFLWWARESGYAEYVDAYTVPDIRRFVSFLQTSEHRWSSDLPSANRRLCDYTVQGHFRSLRAFFNFCEREEFISKSPFSNRRIPVPKVRQKVIPSYGEQQILALLNACDVQEGQLRWYRLRDRAVILLLLDTGIRASELTGIRLCDIQRGKVKVLGKGNKERYTFLSPLVEKAIRNYVERERRNSGAEQLFLSRTGEALTRNGLAQIIQERARQAGIDIHGVHRWRHTFALGFVGNGGSIAALQTILGHESPQMSMKYGRFGSRDAEEAHKRFSPLNGAQESSTLSSEIEKLSIEDPFSGQNPSYWLEEVKDNLYLCFRRKGVVERRSLGSVPVHADKEVVEQKPANPIAAPNSSLANRPLIADSVKLILEMLEKPSLNPLERGPSPSARSIRPSRTLTSEERELVVGDKRVAPQGGSVRVEWKQTKQGEWLTHLYHYGERIDGKRTSTYLGRAQLVVDDNRVAVV